MEAIIASFLNGHLTDVTLDNAPVGEAEGINIDLPQVSLVREHVVTRTVVESDMSGFTISQAHTYVG